MAQGLCPVCKGFGKAHPVIYPTTGGFPKSEILNPKSETNSNAQNSNDQNGERKDCGKVDYSSLVFCVCQGEKALKVAHPAVDYPFTDSDIKAERFYDEFDEARQARYRKSSSFKAELLELFGVEDLLDAGGKPEKDREEMGELMNRLRALAGMEKELRELKTTIQRLQGQRRVNTPEPTEVTGLPELPDIADFRGNKGNDRITE